MAAEYDQDGGIVFGPRTIFGRAIDALDSALYKKFARHDNFNEKQLAVIEKGKAMGIDTAPIENDSIPAHFMEVLLKGLAQGVNVVDKLNPHTAYTEIELELYIEAASKGYDLTHLDKCERNIAKMRLVLQGLNEGLDVSVFTSCVCDSAQAAVMLDSMRAGMPESFTKNLFFGTRSPEKARERLNKEISEQRTDTIEEVSDVDSALNFLDTINEEG